MRSDAPFLSKKETINRKEGIKGNLFIYPNKLYSVSSLSPGLVNIEMEALEKEKGMMMLRATAESRMGKLEEVGYAQVSATDERNGFLAGTGVLCDGRATTKRKSHMRLCMRVRLHNKSKPDNHTESCMIDEADRWRGRNVWYLGRSVRYALKG